MSAKLFILALTLVYFSLGWTAGWAAEDRSEQKRSAESERAQLRKKLTELKKNIVSTESAKQHAEDELADSEVAISSANRKLYGLTKQRQLIEQQLQQLAEEQRQLQTQIEQQKQQFSTLLRQQYETGNTDRVKLLLSGDNPNRIHRELHYLGYVSQSQNQLITELRANLAAVDENKAATEQAKQDLEKVTSEQQQQKSDLVKEQGKHAALVKQLASKLSSQRKEAGHLQKNEQRLSNLVNQLNQQITQQRRAAQLARDEKNKADAKSANGKSTNSKSAPVQITQTPEADSDYGASNFPQLKGRLRLPAKGELVAKYGANRGEGALWKGLFIKANEGADIKSIAAGKVVFADWLRGFGNLIILDHGSQYMSIYGNNQSLLKQVGELVKMGDVIATVGNSGGNEQSGVYFELRFQGKPFDPQSWVN